MTDATWGKIKEIALALGLTRNNVRHWPNRGVPHRYRLAIIELAQEQGIALTSADFEPADEEAA